MVSIGEGLLQTWGLFKTQREDKSTNYLTYPSKRVLKPLHNDFKLFQISSKQWRRIAWPSSQMLARNKVAPTSASLKLVSNILKPWKPSPWDEMTDTNMMWCDQMWYDINRYETKERLWCQCFQHISKKADRCCIFYTLHQPYLRESLIVDCCYSIPQSTGDTEYEPISALPYHPSVWITEIWLSNSLWLPNPACTWCNVVWCNPM